MPQSALNLPINQNETGEDLDSFKFYIFFLSTVPSLIFISAVERDFMDCSRVCISYEIWAVSLKSSDLWSYDFTMLSTFSDFVRLEFKSPPPPSPLLHPSDPLQRVAREGPRDSHAKLNFRPNPPKSLLSFRTN